MLMSDGWIRMEPLWDALIQMGAERDAQKASYSSTKNWSRTSTHFLGLVGEAVVSVLTGIRMNCMLDPAGDGCRDFRWNGYTIDVKGTVYWKNPHLKGYPNPKKWCDIYMLVGVDEVGKRARLFGWATGAELQKAKLVDYGYGAQRSIPHQNLHKGIPTFLPSRCR